MTTTPCFLPGLPIIYFPKVKQIMKILIFDLSGQKEGFKKEIGAVSHRN